MDGLLAATAIAHGLTLVSRNVQDFRGLAVELLDPGRPDLCDNPAGVRKRTALNLNKGLLFNYLYK